ncbi:ABC transporter ATP-binding protein [Rothia nasimurium]|uniref:ABC transporter ATP-binding protein n=1 Tax=Rothia nasimurium TaxID=85336 RepID=A0A4Y9F6D1_9MICC|nr:ABC transporter ATP-binding protein [Rothia nasimurium]MBF0807788.1 ABC transporter ATP-binding protein [Rothia nasimurium]TFU23137.1 ABC transporter ATP-binding protein [Rothia nasimurium]
MSQSPVFTPEELESARRGLESAEQLRDSQLKSEKGSRPGGPGGPGGPPRAPMPGQASAPFKQTMGKLLAYLRPVLPGMVVAIVAAVIGVILNIVAPQFLSAITDEIQKGFTGQLDMGEIYRLMWISIGMLVASLLLSLVEGQIMARSTVWVSRSMRHDLDRKIDRLPLAYMDKGSTGDTLSRVTNDVDTLQQTLNNSLATTITGVVTLVGSAVMMFVTDWRMALATIAASLLGIVASGFVLARSQKYFVAQQQLLGKLNGHIEETLSGHSMIRAYNGEIAARAEFADRNTDLYQVAWKSMFFSGLMFPLMGFIGNLGYVVVCVVGAALVLNNTITFGIIVAFIVYVRLFTNPLGQLAQSATSLQSVAAAGARVFEFLEAEELADESAKSTPMPQPVRGAVDFADVRFSYEPGKEIIHGFTASVAPGQKVAIVGPTGAGKTTLVNLLMRFYELDSGQIRIDGVPTTDLTREQVDSLFAMVLQDTWLFEGTLRENVVYGAGEVSQERLDEVMASVGLDELVSQLHDGYDTVLTDQTQLSAGQKQLVTIARAMVAQKPLLILDEATSSVDTRTELLIARALGQLAVGKTSFVIAHRLSTIRDADVIFAMRDGDIVESGSHAELLERGSFYAELYNSQFAGADE